MSFSAETTSFKNPTQLPEDIMVLLTSDKEDFPNGHPKGLHCTDDEESPRQQDEPVEQILCTKLPLSLSGQDYLVIGVGELRGAHIVPFWIFHDSPAGASLLFKTRSDGFEVLSNRYKGYRELEVNHVFQAGANILTERYRFNGKSYVRFYSVETHN